MAKKTCQFTSSGNHEWDDIAESRDHGGWYKWCHLCGALQSPKTEKGVIYLPLRDEVKQ